MADEKISALPTASALSGSELVPIVQSGSTVKSTVLGFFAPVLSVLLVTGAATHIGIGATAVSSSLLVGQAYTSRDGTGIGSAYQLQRYWDTDSDAWSGNHNCLRVLSQVGNGTTSVTAGTVYSVSAECVLEANTSVTGSVTAIAGTITTYGAAAQSICAAFQVRDTQIYTGGANPYPTVGMEINMPVVGQDSATANNGFGNRFQSHYLARTDYTNSGVSGWSQGYTGCALMIEHTTGAVSGTDGPGAFYWGIVLKDNLNYQTVVNAGSFVIGTQYTICVPGTTDFTAIGAANSNQGTTFTASGAGTGTGTACQGPGPMVNDAIRISTFGQSGLHIGGGHIKANIWLDVGSSTYGQPAYGIICDGAYSTGTAIRLIANQAIALEATNSVRMLYDAGSGQIRFYNGSTIVGHLVVTGGSDHAI